MELVQDTIENQKKCICLRCPSFPPDCKGEILYCAREASHCEIRARGCVCSICPLYLENQLQGLYFCDRVEVGSSRIVMRKQYKDEEDRHYRTVVEVKEVAETGRSILCSMGSRKRMPFGFDDLHFLPAQVAKIPFEREDPVNLAITIGPRAKRPLSLSSPILISGMSLGATSPNVKRIISQVAGKLKIAYNSGEGGIGEEEFAVAPGLIIGQYTTDEAEVDLEVLRKVAAVEIRFGQGAYPGKGSYLPESKASAETHQVRGLKGPERSHSPAHHLDMETPEQIKEKVSWLREVTGGVPIGAKIGCGHIEADLRVLMDVGVDFVALDGFGGGTGATEEYVRENVGIPIIAALPRASGFLRRLGVRDQVSLIAGGGLRTSADFAKCLALGANGVYIATAVLMAIGCQQYRICHTGICPTGVTTHSPVLAKQLEIEEGVRRLANFLRVSNEEIAGLVRIVGKDDVRRLTPEDLVSLHRDLTLLTGVRGLNGK
ncbi:MAG: glutamate synthase-related protein [candidate division NC10 bacterium]|nr:glutamate synthase-related protein [candidate division NC10 bacterium]